eukprot:gb/GEZN01013341.1/.p1 GENE.gb/GEZN01013341.1/~~gb/GEZN01013341.1/.p1  ORF type:complete len:244 (+),score=33.86 gb/GEZN01013341.1/:176-907(+)
MEDDKGEVLGEETAPGEVVFPGDRLALNAATTTSIRDGLVQDQKSLLVTRCGILRSKGKQRTVRNYQKRYLPQPEDLVVGVVSEKHGDVYVLDIGAAYPARLNALAFEGATKRNRPNLNIGALVYARVILANKHMETELTCTSPHFKKEWVTGESVFGQLTGGYMFKCSLSLARKLLADTCPVLLALGAHIPFEVAVGANGLVWVNSASPITTVLITNCILNSEGINEPSMQRMVAKLVQSLA